MNIKCTEESFTGNFVATGHLQGEQPARVYSPLGCSQPLHILCAVGRNWVLVRTPIIEINEWVMCVESLCLSFDLCTCESESSFDKSDNSRSG